MFNCDWKNSKYSDILNYIWICLDYDVGLDLEVWDLDLDLDKVKALMNIKG